jgi:hypothetical protein
MERRCLLLPQQQHPADHEVRFVPGAEGSHVSIRLSLVGSKRDQMKERNGIGTVGLSNYIACANTSLSVESPDNAKKQINSAA